MDKSLIVAKFNSLVEAGLVFFEKEQKTINHIDSQLKFQFLLTSALAKKPNIQTASPQTQQKSEFSNQKRDGSDISTAGYEICDVGSTHILVANKFCFASPHLMLLTSDGKQRQYEALNGDDLQAAWSALTTMGEDFVAFFNCGRDGGCSRLHKHMQMIPKPTDSFAFFLDTKDDMEPDVPFQWFHRRFETNTQPKLLDNYNDLLKQAAEVGAGLSEHADTSPSGAVVPHNFLLTQRWMIVLPRRRAAVNKEAGANAIGMIGVIAVATQKEIDTWIQLGPREALRELGVPKEA